MKRFLVWALILALVPIVGINMFNANAEVTFTEAQVIQHAHALEGSYYTRGYCLEWIATKFWQNLGAPYSSACCAYWYGQNHKQSTSRDNIPIGADVYFSGSSTTCRNGHHAGHIGVYVGDGKVVNLIRYSSDPSDKARVRINTISEIIGWGYPFLGWGFHEGVRIDSVPQPVTISFDPKGGVPSGNLPQGKSYELRGVITATENISSVKGTVYNANTNQVISGIGTNPITISPNSRSVDIYTSKINTSLKFGQLPVGIYRYELIATTVSGTSKTVADSTFTIGHASHTPVPDAAVAATCTEPGLTAGSHCSVCGTVLTAQQTVPKKDHTSVPDAAVAATCTATGLTAGSHCSVCNAVLVAQQTTPPNGHTPVTDVAVPATCTATGLTEGSHCSVCGTVIAAQQVIDKLGHDWGAWQEDTAAGVKRRVCRRDSSHVEIVQITNSAKLTVSATPMQSDGTFTVTLGIADNPGLGGITISSDFASQGVTLNKAEGTGIAAHATVASGMAVSLISTDDLTGNGDILKLYFTSASKEPVTLTFTCEKAANAHGAFAVTGTSAHIDEAPKRTPGDANEDGEVDIVDAMLVLRATCGWDVDINLANSDVNADGEVDIADAMLILRYTCSWNIQLQ